MILEMWVSGFDSWMFYEEWDEDWKVAGGC